MRNSELHSSINSIVHQRIFKGVVFIRGEIPDFSGCMNQALYLGAVTGLFKDHVLYQTVHGWGIAKETGLDNRWTPFVICKTPAMAICLAVLRMKNIPVPQLNLQ